MCFSATANFVGSGVLAGVGVVTLTRVKHRREILFASLPTLFAIHQFTEGFVWLGLDGMLGLAFGSGDAGYGRGVHAVCAGIAAVSSAAERDAV